MKNFNKCSIWEKTDIIDLPFLPFDGEKIVTSKMINESAKYIKRVKNTNYRELNFEKGLINEKNFIFYQADTLIGLDISILDVSSLTYLDQFFFLLKMYPMVMINSFITRESMRKIALHSYCLGHHYILPVFGPIPFLDKALSGEYYGEKIVSLFKGELNKIDVDDFKTYSKEHSINELKIRFPQFDVEDNQISFRPQVTWLGVADAHIEKLLDFLFNNNIEKFNFKKMCIEYKIDESKFLTYIDKSMLFCMEDEEVIFRLQRRNIYWGFICDLAAQFEREMIERDAISYDIKIDESIGTIKSIDEKIYHKLGNLFNKFDSFSYKMFSNIKRLLDTKEYSNVLVVDNGNMSGIVAMLRGIGMQDNLYQVLDFYSVAVKYPNVDYTKLNAQSVLVIIDIINTGRLINSVLEFLESNKCNKIGIFTFIISQDFDIDSLTLEKEITLSYLTEKELSQIDEILDKEYTMRFQNDRDLNFRLLWGEVGKGVELEENKERCFIQAKDENMYKFFDDFYFTLKESINSHSYVYQKIKRYLINIDIILVYKDYTNLKQLIKDIIRDNNLTIEVFDIDDSDMNLTKVWSNYEKKDVLFLIPEKLSRNIQKFAYANKLSKVEFLDLVECQLYSLDSNKIIVESDKRRHFIFQTKLKKFVASLSNPLIDLMDNKNT